MEGGRPVVSLSMLDDLLASQYRLKTVEICELNGHEDRNFHVVCRKWEPLEKIATKKPCLSVKYVETTVQNNTETDLTISTDSGSNTDNYGLLTEGVCPKRLGWAGGELQSANPGVSNRPAESKQVMGNDVCCDWSLSSNASSPEQDASAQFEGLLKVTIDEAWSVVHLGVSKSISKAERVELQMKVATHLRNCGFVCPEAVMSLSTDSLVQELTMNSDGESDKYLVYLTKYIFGSTLNHLLPLSIEMLFEVGNLLAQLHHAVKDISISPEKLSSTSPWSLQNANRIKDFFSEAELDAAEQELVSDVINCFSQNVLSQMSELPRGVIHGDFHDENILLLKKDQTEISNEERDSYIEHDLVILKHPECIRTKYGVIDFGDVSHSAFIFDLAIATSYFMMCDPRPDFMQNVAHFLSGYFTSYKPTTLELRSLFSSICAAYCRETVLCKYTYLEQHKSNEYMLTYVDAGWRQLKELWTLGQEEVLSVWSETWKKYELHLEL